MTPSCAQSSRCLSRDTRGLGLPYASSTFSHDFVRYVIAHDLPDPIRAQLAVNWACSGSSTRGVGGHRPGSAWCGISLVPAGECSRDEVPDRHLSRPPRPLTLPVLR